VTRLDESRLGAKLRQSGNGSKPRRKTMRKEERKTTREESQVTIEQSSGNVFADLAHENPEEMLAKAELVQRIGDIIVERKLTQTKAASLLGIDQPKISALMRGKLDGFSIDRLFRFLNALGRDVEIVIRPARQVGDAGTRVISA
jgi:predicted XRE-type DNA-binding protein